MTERENLILLTLKVCYRKENFVPIVRLITAKANEQILSNEFLYYCLCNTHIWGDGSVQKQLTVPMISEYIVRIPPLNIQSKIVHVLKSLDDKIEVNRRINDNLEQQAQALFKSWFVDFEPFRNGEFVDSELGRIPKGWGVKLFKDVCDNITDGVHNTVKDDLDGDYYLLSCKNIKGGFVSIGDNERRISKETFDKLRKRTKMQKGDILLSSVGTIGEIVLLNEEPSNYEFQRSVAILKPKKELISSQFLYYSMDNQRDKIVHTAHGAVQQCIFISDVANFTTIYPPIEEIQRFTDFTLEIRNEISKNEQESLRLSELRDTLLPKLMSGELKVNDIEKNI